MRDGSLGSRDERTLIVVPAYNEEGSIDTTLTDLHSNCPWADVVVVDDGSTDATAAIVSASGVAEVVRLPFNLGIGGAVQTGFQYAVRHGYDAAVQVDGDGQHPADQVATVLAPVLDGRCDVCVGSRFLDPGGYRQSRLRAVGIRVLARVISMAVRERVTDPTSGFRAYNRRAIRALAEEYPYDYPEPEALVFLYRAGFRVQEVPVRMEPRRGGVSSISASVSVKYMAKVLLAIGVSVFRPSTTAAGE